LRPRQFEIVLDVGIARVMGLGLQQRLAGAPMIAPQHVGVAAVVEDFPGRASNLYRLLIGSVGKLEPAQPIV
jgi:hypothetical protein